MCVFSSDLQSKSEQLGSPSQVDRVGREEVLWPRIVQGSVKDWVLHDFVHATSFNTLQTFICASCTARYPVCKQSLEPLSNLDLSLLTCLDQ